MPGEVEFEEDIDSLQPLVLNRPDLPKSPLVRILMKKGVGSRSTAYILLVLISCCFFAASFYFFTLAKPSEIPYSVPGLQSSPATNEF